MATDKDEIKELKALVKELQGQVLSAGRLAGVVASSTVASPEVAVERVPSSAGRHVRQNASKKRMVQRLWKKADNLAAAAREATAEAEAVEAAGAGVRGFSSGPGS